MAIDFAKLPPKETVPDDRPSRLLWTVVFFAIAIIGVFSMLFLWPKGESTQTPWFWTCITVYPFGVAAFVLLRRYSIYKGCRLDAVAWNDARENYVNEAFDRASRPLGVLATTFRFASDAAEDDLGELLNGSVKLEPRIALKPDAPPVNARWFEMPDKNEDGIRFRSDDERRHHVLAWAFSTLTDTVAEAVRSIPLDLRLNVQLLLPGISATDEALAIWRRQWARSDLRPVQVSLLPELADPMYVDEWLDRVNSRLDEEARLVVCVRLNTVLQALPPDGSAEAAAAVLVAPEAVCQKFDLGPVATLHRPNGMSNCSIDDALARALRWGRAEPAEVKRIWQSGIDAVSAGTTTQAVVKARIGAKVENIDYMVGHAGAAAPWLAVACAANAAVRDGAPQLVTLGGKTGACFSVLRNVR